MGATRRRLGVTILLLAAACGPAVAGTVILVRHAEKVDQSKDSGLSAAGIRRAEALATLLRDAGVDAIVTSEYRRTADTAAPLARMLKIEPVVVPAGSGDELAARLREKHAGDVVLVVGHSNTVPELIRKLGGADFSIPDAEYDNLFVVTLLPEGRASVVRLRFGE